MLCKPPENFYFQKTEQSFRFAWFEEFSCVRYFWWEDRTYCLPSLLFFHKNVGKSLEKTISNTANISKNIKKHENVPMRTNKRDKYSFKDF